MDDETRLITTGDSRALAVSETTAIVPVAVDELATKVIAALDLLAAIIPDLRKPHPETAPKVRGARTVSREAVTSIVAMVEASPALQTLKTMDTERAHEILSSSDAYRLVAERLEMLLTQVKYTSEARWAEVAAEAMSSYHMAGILARRGRDSERGELAAHLATIRKHLGRRNAATGKKKKEPKAE